MDIADRFWSKVDKSGDCWLWTAAVVRNRGYGRFSVLRRGELAHRVAWELTNGKVPRGLEVCHRCDVPGCVNPAHLFLATHAENMADMAAKDRATHGSGSWFRPKIPAEVIEQIRLDPRPQPEVAAAYGVHQSTVSRIRAGKARHRDRIERRSR